MAFLTRSTSDPNQTAESWQARCLRLQISTHERPLQRAARSLIAVDAKLARVQTTVAELNLADLKNAVNAEAPRIPGASIHAFNTDLRSPRAQDLVLDLILVDAELRMRCAQRETLFGSITSARNFAARSACTATGIDYDNRQNVKVGVETFSTELQRVLQQTEPPKSQRAVPTMAAILQADGQALADAQRFFTQDANVRTSLAELCTQQMLDSIASTEGISHQDLDAAQRFGALHQQVRSAYQVVADSAAETTRTHLAIAFLQTTEGSNALNGLKDKELARFVSSFGSTLARELDTVADLNAEQAASWAAHEIDLVTSIDRRLLGR